MNTHADKTQEYKSRSVANAVSQKQSDGESKFQFVDYRPEAMVQRKLQEMAISSLHVQQAAQMQSVADNNSIRQQQPIQKKTFKVKSGSQNFQRKLVIGQQEIESHRITKKGAFKTRLNQYISTAAREKNIAPYLVRNLLYDWSISGKEFSFHTKLESALKAAEVLAHRKLIQSRIGEFNRDMSESESSGQDRNIPKRVDAIKHDPNKGEINTLSHEESGGPSMSLETEREKANAYFKQREKIGRSIPEEWKDYLSGETGEGPYGLKAPKFMNLFGPEAVVMLENYRPPWKKYFASDVFFSQWLSSLGKTQDLTNLPKYFPKYFYRNHIDNKKTLLVLKNIVKAKRENPVILDHSSEWWKSLAATPNAASTFQIIKEYNAINAAQGGGGYKIDLIQIHQDSNKNFALKFTTSEA